MKTHPNLEHILFLDIETVPEVNSYAVLNPKAQELFAAKTAYAREKEHISAEAFILVQVFGQSLGKLFVFRLAT